MTKEKANDGRLAVAELGTQGITVDAMLPGDTPIRSVTTTTYPTTDVEKADIVRQDFR